MAETLAEGLDERGYDATACGSSTEAARRLGAEAFDALVTDLRMPGVDGMGLLALSRKAAPERPVIVMTGYGAIETAVDAIREGAYHYLTKPFALDELALFLERALDHARVRGEARSLRAVLRDRVGLGSLVAKSAAMHEVFDIASRVADADTPVLIMGETGHRQERARPRDPRHERARGTALRRRSTARRCPRRSSRASSSAT